jgi:hypothetical protein
MKRFLIGVAFVVAAIAIWFALLWVPEWMASQYDFEKVKDWAAQVAANRTLLLSMIGGIGVAVTSYLAYGTFVLSQEAAKIARETFTATQDRIVTETMSQAIEHLSSDNASARLGGVYTLVRIAKKSEPDYFPIIQILTGFLRTLNQEPDPGSVPKQKKAGRFDCPDEVRAVLTAIGERYFPDAEGYSIELSYTKIHDVWLP